MKRERTEKLFFFFPKTFDHSEDTAIGKSGGLQQPVAAACRSHCVKCVWNIGSTVKRDLGQWQSSGLHLCPQQGHLEKSFTAEITPEQGWGALASTFFLFHYLFRHWLGWEPEPMSTLLNGIFHLIWKHVFVKLAQVSLWSGVNFKFSFSYHLLLLFGLNRNRCLIDFGSPADALGQS